MITNILLPYKILHRFHISLCIFEAERLKPSVLLGGSAADLVSQDVLRSLPVKSGKMFRHQGSLAIRSVDTEFSDALTSSNHFQIAL